MWPIHLQTFDVMLFYIYLRSMLLNSFTLYPKIDINLETMKYKIPLSFSSLASSILQETEKIVCYCSAKQIGLRFHFFLFKTAY